MKGRVLMNLQSGRGFAFVFLALTWVVPSSLEAQSAKPLLDKVVQVASQRAEGVTDYAMDITMMGHDTTLFYERVTTRTPTGKPAHTFRLVSFDEMRKRQEAGQGMSPEAWQAYSDAMRQTGSAMSKEMDKGMNEAGLPPGMRDAMGSGAEAEPWASPNPGTMMNSMAVFADAAGDASNEREARTDDAATAEGMALFRKRAKVVGKESVGKRRAIHTRAEDLNLVEESDGQQLTIDSISLWIDAEKHVPLKMRMEGVAKQKRESREIFMERLDLDYRTVPGSKLYMPYRSVVRMQGILGPDQQKQMEDARKQLDDLDKQLAEMSPEERARFEKLAGSQIATLRKMVDGGQMEMETEVRAIRVNTGLAGAFPSSERSQPAASATRAPTGDPLVQKSESVKEAQAACLQEKIDEAKKKKRAFGKLMRAAANTASRYGSAEVSSEVDKASQKAYDADATAKDVEEAANALGLSEKDVEACRNPK